MERLTTDNPRNNTEVALNLVYVKDGQAWVRNGGPAPGYPDVELYDYMRLIVADHGPMSIKADLTDDELGDALYDALFDGIETKEGLCAMLYTLAWAFAELRQRLAAYEDTGLEPEEITDYLPMLREWRQNTGALRHVHEMVKAETEGRLIVLPCKVGEPCFRIYNCHCGCRERCKKKKEAKLIDVVPYPCYYMYYCKRIAESKFTLKDIANFGKTVFLTREEAEAALKQEG